MGKGIGRIYEYDQRNCPYPSSNTTFVIPKNCGNYIQTQRNSYSDGSIVSHDLASAGLDQSTNHHGNIDVKDNDASHSLETPRENNCSPSCFGDTITTTTTPRSSTLLPPGK